MELFFIFTFGLVVGSFLNAVIYRLPFDSVQGKKSALRGRSYCPHCKHTLAWYDLIPLVSFAQLRGRCRYCKKQISLQYPLVELATGVIFFSISEKVVHTDNFSAFGELVYLWVVASLLIVLFVYDLRHYILPDKILLPAIFVVCIWYFVSSVFLGAYTRYEILNTLYAAAGAAGFFFAIFALSKGRAMGFGDVKLALFMGLFLGFPHILVALFVAFLTGAIIGIGLIVLKKKQLKSEIPFGPFLIFGTFVALFWGNEITQWYLRF